MNTFASFAGDSKVIQPPRGTVTEIDTLGHITVETPSGAVWRLLWGSGCEQKVRKGRLAGSWVSTYEPGWAPAVRARYDR